MLTQSLISLFNVDVLAVTMVGLVLLIGSIIGSFSRRYMAGDANYYSFLCLLSLLVLSLAVMVTADHLLLLLAAWAVSNFLLVQLMVHKSCWQAATASGWLTAKNMMFGYACLVSAFVLFYYSTGQSSVSAVLKSLDTENPLNFIALILLLVAAMTQSAIWPFHRWLISSLNSPTPVSAMMHAGLVNGGGLLLARFASCYLSYPTLLLAIFILGLGTALIGTLWKLMQNDMKRMLACSTMAQMGFMLAQCGLGLFAAAVAHLCWHGLFKANSFLSSSSAAQEKRLNIDYPPTIMSFTLALVCGCFGDYVFSLTSHQVWLVNDTTLILFGVTFIAASQFTLILLKQSPWRNLPITIVLTAIVSGLYGLSIVAIESLLTPLQLMHPQTLNIFHLIGFALLVVTWLLMLFHKVLTNVSNFSRILSTMYVKALNAGQPHAATITVHRNQYRYE